MHLTALWFTYMFAVHAPQVQVSLVLLCDGNKHRHHDHQRSLPACHVLQCLGVSVGQASQLLLVHKIGPQRMPKAGRQDT